MRLISVLLLAALNFFAADNRLTSVEKKAGWQLLFDGKTFTHWQSPGDSWAIEDGAIASRLNPRIEEDLTTTQTWGDFELQFDWRVSDDADTSLIYRMQKTVFLDPDSPLPFEARLERELAQPTRIREDLPPQKRGVVCSIGFEMPLSGQGHAGEWRHSRLVVKGAHFEHWVDGELALAGSLDDPSHLAELHQRWAHAPAVYEILAHPKPSGPLALRHGKGAVWFRNLKIRPTGPPGLNF